MRGLSPAGGGDVNRRTAQVFCLLFLMWPLNLLAAGMDRFYGVWSGRVTEIRSANDAGSSYAVTIQILPGQVSVDYSELGCRGVLLPRRHEGRYLDFRDRLDTGADHCESRGRTELFLLNAGRVAYLWFDARGQLRAGGYLRRQQQLAVLSKQEHRKLTGASEKQRKIGW